MSAKCLKDDVYNEILRAQVLPSPNLDIPAYKYDGQIVRRIGCSVLNDGKGLMIDVVANSKLLRLKQAEFLSAIPAEAA